MIYMPHIKISDYDYMLPEDSIAKYPLAIRDQSKLLTRSTDGKIGEDLFINLPKYLRSGSLMIFNNTKVIQARLHFYKNTGARIEIFCLEPCSPLDYQQNFSAHHEVVWTCLIGNLKKWKEGVLEKRLTIAGKPTVLHAERMGTSGTGHEIRFSWDSDSISWAEILESIGELPIPPYLNRETEESDLHTYQTVYSKIKGSVAAPTAGLHFTEQVLEALDTAGIERNELTLHVGAGTFKPVKTEDVADHTMHAEWISVSLHSIERLLAHNAHCIAVGTTSVRTLESLYYIGVRLHEWRMKNRNMKEIDLHITQWYPYDYEQKTVNPLSPVQALEEVKRYLVDYGLSTLHTTTQIIIMPGYKYKIVKTIITNFHQPRSTLLLLVSAFVGGDWRTMYDYAHSHNFRFLSYGDSSILNYDAL